MVLILFFVLILNVVALALTYYCLSNVDKKEKIIFIAVGIAITYIITSVVYGMSTKDITIKEVSETGKNLIMFIFVPVNAIITLPIAAKSYGKYKIGRLASDKLRNRVIVLAILLLILLGIEHSYFKDIQNDVVKLIENNKQVNEVYLNEIIANDVNTDENQIVENNMDTNEINNNIENTINTVQ